MRALAGRHGFIYHSTKMTQKILRLIVSVFDVTPEFFFYRDNFLVTISTEISEKAEPAYTCALMWCTHSLYSNLDAATGKRC